MTKELIETLQDGGDGFTSGAEKLEKDGETSLAASFRELGAQRSALIGELQKIAASYGDHISDSGSVAAKVHRGWMAVKDAIAGSDPDGVLEAAVQGEDHAVAEFDKAIAEDLSPESGRSSSGWRTKSEPHATRSRRCRAPAAERAPATRTRFAPGPRRTAPRRPWVVDFV